MMATILNSSAILHWILPSRIQPFCTKKLHSFFLTQLDDGSHFEFCHLGFRHCHLGFRHLLYSPRLTQKHSPSTLTLTQTNSISLMYWWQPSWILPSWIQPFCTKLWLKLVQSDSNSFILTQLDDISHLELCHVGFRHCHLGFKHLVIFSQIHSKTLSPPLWLCLKLIPSDKLNDGNHLEFCHLGFSHFAQNSESN